MPSLTSLSRTRLAMHKVTTIPSTQDGLPERNYLGYWPTLLQVEKGEATGDLKICVDMTSILYCSRICHPFLLV